MAEEIYKVVVSVPVDHADVLMDAIDDTMEPLYPGYRRCFSTFDVIGTWIPQDGSEPFIGEHGTIARMEERRIEFAVRECDLRPVLRTIDRTHPYEEPSVDVIPMVSWRSLL